MSKKERKLSKAEEKRKKLYEEKKKQLISEGYQEKNLTIGIIFANIMAFVLGLPIIIPLLILFIHKNQGGLYRFDISGCIMFLITFIALVVVHELIHGLFWAIYAENHLKSIEFGFMVSSLTPYCCCKDMLTKYQYIIGGIMPTVILGIIPAVIAIFTESCFLFTIGEIMILAGGGDMTILLKLLMYKSDKQEVLYMDHPYECGLIVFER
ncbi:DUF3267 domain-containing protein [Intestinibacter sp.]